MVLWATILFLQGAGLIGSIASLPGMPENITVMFLTPSSVRVSWSTSQVEKVEKYDVIYKPTDARYLHLSRSNSTENDESQVYRVMAVVAGNSDAVTLTGLRPDTQYQLVVTAVRDGKKFRSRPIVFRTLEPPRTSSQQDAAVTGVPIPPPPPSAQQPQTYMQVRGVEVGIVVIVLMVWAGAIALFFNRWGKIRMLLPYQPDYKEATKVPGTGVCTATNPSYTQHPTQHPCSQHMHWSNHQVDSLESNGCAGWPRSTRPRVNSAIDVAGFLSQEFLRRHGSTSRLCRKVRSADNLPLASCNRQQDQNRSSHEDDAIDVDQESFCLYTNQEDSEKSEENTKGQSSIDNGSKSIEPIPEACFQPQPTRDLMGNSASLLARRFSGWRSSGSHEYARCPVRQPTSVDERCYRRSCELDPGKVRHLIHHHHRRLDNEKHSKSCDNTKPESSNVEVHFGLPILSVSEPSPPDETEDRIDERL